MRITFPRWNESLGNLEQEYRVHYLPADARQMSIAIIIWQIPNILLAYADFQIFNGSMVYWSLLVVRLSLLLLSACAVQALRKAVTPQVFDRTLLVWFAAAISFVLYINATWATVAPVSSAFTVMILLTIYLIIPGRMFFRLIPALYMTIGSIFVCLRFGPTVTPVVAYLLMVGLLMANLLGIIFSAKLYDYRRKIYLAQFEEARIREELHRLASTDELTGVFNRRKLLELAKQEFDLFKQNGQPLAVLMIDIDHFKSLNDQHGHPAGDKILTRFTAFIAQNIRQTDVWGRLGGEEFVLVLPNTAREQAEIISERFRQESSQLVTRIGDKLLDFTISVGVTAASASDQTFLDILTRADIALYLAKKNGRNRTEAV
ncbi:MAG: GGDEF domain-containing protein [Negativicutes bacterium]|nr:GGDEF domain-containing protein [Negativicutes bacterium]